jgi:glycosyltransferase involved in cell wall biosynthesis/Tfp pilus assembly protein PilF
MSVVEGVLEQAARLAGEGRHAESLAALESAISVFPDDPEINARLGLALCLVQREPEAAARLELAAGAKSFGSLAQTLTDHFHCRQTILMRLGLDDPETTRLAARCRELSGLEPRAGARLSVCMIVRDEAHQLERCLRSVEAVADEVIVVDTGSEDGTRELADRLGARVAEFAWTDDFAAARNAALALATGDWVLTLDADEELAPAGLPMVREALTRPQFGGFLFTIVNYLRDEGDEAFVHSALRLFRRLPGVRYAGAVHEQVDLALATLGLPVARLVGPEILHHGYRPSVMGERGKAERTIRLVQRELEREPNDPFHHFNLGNAHAAAGDHASAVAPLRRAIDLAARQGVRAQYVRIAPVVLASCLLATNRPLDAEEVCARADREGLGGMGLDYVWALALEAAGRPSEALARIEACVARRWDDEEGGDRAVATKRHEAHRRILDRLAADDPIGQADRETRAKRPARGLAILEAALRANPDDAELNARYGLLLCRMQREREALERLESAKGAPSWPTLAQTLVDHYHCRRLMADRLGHEDVEGRALLAEAISRTGVSPGDVGIGLSACLIVKNEERRLDRCLASLKGLADQIVVVDTGSTDGTVAIAERHGATIGRFDWIDDFSAARNASLELATQPWVLWIDADEEVAEGSADAIREGLMRPHFGGFSLRIRNFMSEEATTEYVHTPIRLFRNHPHVRFQGRIHEQVLPRILELGWPVARLTEAVLNHYGYTPAAMSEKNKVERTVTMLERELEENPRDTFQWFNLANVRMVAAQFAEAEQAARRALDLLMDPEGVPMDPGYVGLTYDLLATSLVAQNRSEEALALIDEAMERGFDGVTTSFERAQALLKLGRLDEALAAIDRAMAMPWPEEQVGDFGIVTHKGHLLRGQILFQMGRLAEAVAMFRHAYGFDPSFALAAFSLGAGLARLGEHDEARQVLAPIVDHPAFRHDVRLLLAEIAFEQGDAPNALSLLAERWEQGACDESGFMLWLRVAERLGDAGLIAEVYGRYAETCELGAGMLVNWGRSLQEVGRHEQALSCFQEAIRRAPGDANAYFCAGDLLYVLGAYGDAAHLYEAGLRLAPGSAMGWFVLGNSLAQLNLNDGARMAYDQALSLDPGLEAARLNREQIAA